MRIKAALAIALMLVLGRVNATEIHRRIVLKSEHQETVVSGRIPHPSDTAVFALRLPEGHFFLQLDPGPSLRAFALLKPPTGPQVGPGAKLDYVVQKTGMFQIRIVPREQTSGTFQLRLSLQ